MPIVLFGVYAITFLTDTPPIVPRRAFANSRTKFPRTDKLIFIWTYSFRPFSKLSIIIATGEMIWTFQVRIKYVKRSRTKSEWSESMNHTVWCRSQNRSERERASTFWTVRFFLINECRNQIPENSMKVHLAPLLSVGIPGAQNWKSYLHSFYCTTRNSHPPIQKPGTFHVMTGKRINETK